MNLSFPSGLPSYLFSGEEERMKVFSLLLVEMVIHNPHRISIEDGGQGLIFK